MSEYFMDGAIWSVGGLITGYLFGRFERVVVERKVHNEYQQR